MGGPLIINVLDYTHVSGSPVTSSMCLQTIFVVWLKLLLVDRQFTVSGFTNLLVHLKTIKYKTYALMVGSPTIYVMFSALSGGSTKLKVQPFTLVLLDSQMNLKKD